MPLLRPNIKREIFTILVHFKAQDMLIKTQTGRRRSVAKFQPEKGSCRLIEEKVIIGIITLVRIASKPTLITLDKNP